MTRCDMKMTLSFVVRTVLVLLAIPSLTVVSHGATNPPARLKVDDTPLNREVKARTSFSPIIKKIGPSVVNIYSTMTVKQRSMRDLLGDDPSLRRFFGEDPSDQRQDQRKPRS